MNHRSCGARLFAGMFVVTVSLISAVEGQTATGAPKQGAVQTEAIAHAHHFDRVVVIVLENADYDLAMKALRDRKIALAEHGIVLQNYHALYHLSYPNYLALVAGTDFGVGKKFKWFTDQQIDFPDDDQHRTLADRFAAKGIDWKNYAEELPEGNCRFDTYDAKKDKANYVRRHLPFLSFREVQAKWCDHVVHVASEKADNQFVKDASGGALPAYSFYSPNMDNDGHQTGVGAAMGWVANFLDKKFPENLRKGTLVVVTFDEAEPDHDHTNHIFTLLLGDMLKDSSQVSPDALKRYYNHYSLLRTIEDNFGLEPLTENDRKAEPIKDIWK